MTMKVLRTPDNQFENLPDYDFEPTYTTIQDEDGTELRIHSVDVGPKDAAPILLMHGNPTWSYIYRHVIKGLLPTGRRIIAVDLVGCGRSDKPAKRKDYTLARHQNWMKKWLLANDLNNITLVCQDWGGTLGLKLVTDFPERFDRVLATNTGVPTGDGGNNWLRWWLRIMKLVPSFPWNIAFKTSMVSKKLTKQEYRAFRSPFPSIKYQVGILKFPQLITVFPEHPEVELNRQVWEKLTLFTKPFLNVYGNRDPVTRGISKLHQKYIPGCKGLEHIKLEGIGHFSPEEAPEALITNIIEFLDKD